MTERGVLVALLAAGQATRFGGGKLDADCGGKPLGMWAVEAAEEVQFATRMIVVPGHIPAFANDLKGWRLTLNPAPDEGLAGSVRIAAREARGYARLVVALADMPLIEAAHLRAIANSDTIAFTAYPEGRRGVPAGFPARCFETLADLTGSAAQQDWDENVTLLAPASSAALIDVDTPEDLSRVESLLAAKDAALRDPRSFTPPPASPAHRRS